MLTSHFMNLILALQVLRLTSQGSGCVWYLMNYLLDVTLGTVISLTLLSLLNKHVFDKKLQVSSLPFLIVVSD